MRFPVDVATTQLRGDARQPVTFFETLSGDLGALRGNDRVVESDFEDLMSVLLRDGPCEFRIPSELTLPSESSSVATGIIQLEIALEPDQSTGSDTFSIYAAVEREGKRLVDAEPVRDACLGHGIEEALECIARHGKIVPRRCYFCRFSDYEPSASLGLLRCYLGEAVAYCDAAAEIQSNPDARYRIFGLRGQAVDDLGTCAAFEIRPPNWGYRG
jgi:hypothetical protein